MSMPALSLDLVGPRHPEYCQACGTGPAPELQRWRECNVADVATDTVVVLCQACSKQLVKDHPRLYLPLDRWEPAPGCMLVCVACRHRDGTLCRHPNLKRNGGPGLEIFVPKPRRMHVYGDRNGRRFGEWRTFWPGPVAGCSGSEALETPAGGEETYAVADMG